MFIRKNVARMLIGVAIIGGLTALGAVVGARAVRKGRMGSALLGKLRLRASLAGAAALLSAAAASIWRGRRMRRMALLVVAPLVAVVTAAGAVGAGLILRGRRERATKPSG